MSAVVQRDSFDNIASASTRTLPACVAGNRVCFAVLHSYAGTPPTLAITNTTGLTKHVNNYRHGSSAYLHVWSAEVSANGDCVATFTFAAGTIRIGFCSEVSGLDNASPYGGVNALSNAGSTSISAGAVTPTVDGSYLMFLARSGTSGHTPPSGFTEVRDITSYQAADFVQATAAAITPIATTAGSSANEGYVVFFNAVAAATDALVVDDQPSNSWTGEVIRPPVVVNLTTDGSTIDTGATDTVTAAIASGTGTLSGTTSVAAVAGVATFSNLIITGSGPHTLTFTASGYTGDTSASFKVATGTGVPGGGIIIQRKSDMQTIVKNSTDTDELTVIVEALDDAAASVDISAATLRVGGSTLAETDFTGTITRRGTSSTHLCVFTQAQSNAFGIGERGYLRIPGTTGALESTISFFVTEAPIGDAPFDFDATLAEATAVPSATASFIDKFKWMFALARNKITQTATTQLVRNDADSATIGTATVSDDGTTAIRGEFS